VKTNEGKKEGGKGATIGKRGAICFGEDETHSTLPGPSEGKKKTTVITR